MLLGLKESRDLFVQDEQKTNAIMLNALIESSYKLKEWRVGDPAGLSRKYKGKPDEKKSEYFISKNSFVAVQAILNTHLQVLSQQEFKNFGSLIKSYELNNELSDALMYLNASLEEAKKIKNDDFSQAEVLYENLKKLHTTYYISLIGKLKITSKILDADGD
ncbi:MAG: imelysin family protein [Sulfurimonas sp.]|nr:imelysin family protein [Sulfurimonas sp.]